MFRELVTAIAHANGTKLIAIVGYIAYLAVSIYLCITGGNFQYYSEFAALTAGSGTLAAIGGRYIDSALNSPRGEIPQNK
ncbi:MAG: hypothetical protein WCV63_03395 [Negativicutes bacterium]|jgi:hypothetical protein